VSVTETKILIHFFFENNPNPYLATMPTRLHRHPNRCGQQPPLLDKLNHLAHALQSEVPLRIEIRGSHQQKVSVVSSSGRSDISFRTIPNEALELLSQQALLPKVLIVDIYNDQLAQVLRSLSSNVRNLDVANCCVSDADGGSFDLTHLKFQSLTSLNVYSSRLREDHLHALLQASAPLLSHFSLYLVAGARSIDAIFRGIYLPCLTSVDFRGCFVSRDKCFHVEHLPNLTNVVIVETLGSQVHLGHVVSANVGEILLGKTIATTEDLRIMGEALCRVDCKIRRMHLFAVDLQTDVTETALEGLMQAIRHNQSLVEIVIGADAFRSRQEELRLLMMRNKYLTQGLGRIKDVRMLPQFLNKSQKHQRFTIFGTANREQIDAVYYMVKERPDLFCRA
jgi:hypothetical protein